MNFDDYQKSANRTLMGKEQVLTNCALGLTGESGEVADLVRKYTFQSNRLDKDQLVKEMGDVLWYLSQIAEWADIPFDEVAADNIKRLEQRYPDTKK
ncbi:nucleotide pyrophosphohydrolase [Lentilactobacillus parafarraginis]|jgi:NTP pyrophosphatase (non-canonical NTP hydrolase)|uniref:MazG nucleotide pyrophosphohydrolase domain protein n=2 Tax=Lentilactobacillus parafarraginis TaxID=390842 RepID=A0A0R1YPV0_9LACO|nr:nucleoside triphosphate pyrophosphohydrolase family protein [Lentilactobacillus parafarraginis]KRM44456.1 MazG nucleotide pyrophosphohydrolase domain protein [Lentilactobacillus parafarraginis DSM 18390 = JCM 14109]TLQ15807.1 nucleotide pyrophosphohydrolase [Lentilactobacillus parafarraginis]